MNEERVKDLGKKTTLNDIFEEFKQRKSDLTGKTDLQISLVFSLKNKWSVPVW